MKSKKSIHSMKARKSRMKNLPKGKKPRKNASQQQQKHDDVVHNVDVENVTQETIPHINKENTTMTTTNFLTEEQAIERALKSPVTVVPVNIFSNISRMVELHIKMTEAEDELKFYATALIIGYAAIDSGEPQPSVYFADEIAFIELKVKALKGVIDKSIFEDIDVVIQSKISPNKNTTTQKENKVMTTSKETKETSFFDNHIQSGLFGLIAGAASSVAMDMFFDDDKETKAIATHAAINGAAGGAVAYGASRLINIEKPTLLKSAGIGLAAGAIVTGGSKAVEHLMKSNAAALSSVEIPGIED